MLGLLLHVYVNWLNLTAVMCQTNVIDKNPNLRQNTYLKTSIENKEKSSNSAESAATTYNANVLWPVDENKVKEND